jgi:hypothetical protein
VGAVDTGWCLCVSLDLQLNWSAHMKLGRTEIKEHRHASCSLQQEMQSNGKGVLHSSRFSVLYNPFGYSLHAVSPANCTCYNSR